jgi:two-component system LytT family sensor kinase
MEIPSRMRWTVNLRLDDENSNRLFWILQVSGWLGICLFSYFSSLLNGMPWDGWIKVFPVYLVGFVGTLGLRLLLRWWRSLPPPALAAAMAMPSVLVGAAMSFTLMGMSLWTCEKPECEPWKLMGWFEAMVAYTYLILAWVFLYITLRFYRAMQQQSRSLLAATAMAHQAQLKMLRYQLNPHFLFNTLNAISTLVLDRANDTANRMVQSLSAFLRHSLDSDPMQRVTFKQELDALRLYLDIEKVRFAERLQIEYRIEPECYSALLPSLLLQPLIENAIKYAVARRVEGGRLEISARRDGDMLELMVADDGPGSPQFAPGAVVPPPGNGHGVGLVNTRERLKVLYGERQQFIARNRQPQGAEVLIRLPFEAGGAPRE